jgi:hypothetical protein
VEGVGEVPVDVRPSSYPRFSVAIRTISAEISFIVPGRPGRFGANVHFRAISSRYHLRILHQILDHLLLLAVEPPGQRRE